MNIFILIPLVCATVYGALAVIALRHPTRARVVFTLYLIAGTGWSSCSAMAHLGFSHQLTYIWAASSLVLGSSMMVLYYHFIRRFANKRPDVLVYLGYTAWLASIFLVARGYIIQRAYFANGSLYIDYANYAMNSLVVVSSVFVIAAAVVLIQYYRSSTDAVNRTRALYLLIGIAAFAGFGITKTVPALFKYPLDYVGGVVNALIISYVILKYQLLNIKFVLRKGLVYSNLTIFITVLYLLLLLTLQTYFHEWIGYGSLALTAVVALMIALLFNPLRNFFQKWIDRLFYRETYDYRQMLLKFSNKISNVLDLGELAQSILEPLGRAMHVKRAALLFPEIGSGDFKARFVQQDTDEKPFTKLKLLSDNPIVSWLATRGGVLRRKHIDIMPQFKGVWQVERVILDVLGVELLCPIRSRGNLIGIIAIGEKQYGSSYSDEEADLLITMSHEAAVALENARMLDSLKSQQLQVEQLLAQVVLAQEEERNRISIDLHDSVAQWLVATSYGMQTFREQLSEKEADKARLELVDMESTITRSLKELRRVVVGLRPPALDELGLAHALQQGLEELEKDGMECQFSQMGTPWRLPSSMEIAVFRVVQEAISNIRKHAKATRVNLRLQFQEDKLLVDISDNGQGFNLSQTLDSAISVGHLGLLGMKQRAEMLGGDIQIKTGEGDGTTITLDLPIQSRVEEK